MKSAEVDDDCKDLEAGTGQSARSQRRPIDQSKATCLLVIISCSPKNSVKATFHLTISMRW